MIYLYIVIGVVMLLTALLFVPVRVYVEYGGKQLQLELWVLKFRFNIKNFMNKPKKQSAKNQSTIEEKQLTFIEKINSIYKKIVYLKKV